MSLNETDLFHTENKLARAIARIKNYCTGKKTLVAFSGGKDSQCCYHLCQDAGVEFSAQYSITRFEPPELIRFIRDNYPDVTFRRAYRRSLVEEIGDDGLPNRWFRWCCDAKHRKTPGFDIVIIGVRAGMCDRSGTKACFVGKNTTGNTFFHTHKHGSDSTAGNCLGRKCTFNNRNKNARNFTNINDNNAKSENDIQNSHKGNQLFGNLTDSFDAAQKHHGNQCGNKDSEDQIKG